jgi:cell division protein FtsB
MVESKKPGQSLDQEPPLAEDYEGTPSNLLSGKLDAILKIAAAGGDGDEPVNDVATAAVAASEAVATPDIAGETVDAAAAADADDGRDEAHARTLRGRRPGAAKRRAANDEFPDSAGIVSLLSALKADIDALRRENEAFKAQLMAGPVRATTVRPADEPLDLRQLLAILKADIESLRHENDFIRSQAFAMQSSTTAIQSAEHDLAAMLSELRADIVALKKENDALRREHSIGVSHGGGGLGHHDDVARLFAELKSDINALKHENEALRLENLASRDGARLGLGQAAYRSEGRSSGGVWRSIAMLAVVGMAAGGGYFLALSRSPQPAVPATAIAPVALPPLTAPAEVAKAPVAPTAPVAAPVRPVASEPPAGDDTRPATLDGNVESVMLARAEQLVRSRDLGAARMLLVYLARKGSAVATRKLAESYDPTVLAERQIDGAASGGDMERAKRLYAAAVRMGDKAAADRLGHLQD